MNASIAIGLSRLCIDGQRNLDILSKPWRVFLRKAAVHSRGRCNGKRG